MSCVATRWMLLVCAYIFLHPQLVCALVLPSQWYFWHLYLGGLISYSPLLFNLWGSRRDTSPPNSRNLWAIEGANSYRSHNAISADRRNLTVEFILSEGFKASHDISSVDKWRRPVLSPLRNLSLITLVVLKSWIWAHNRPGYWSWLRISCCIWYWCYSLYSVCSKRYWVRSRRTRSNQRCHYVYIRFRKYL